MKRSLSILLALLWASPLGAADRIRIGYSSISGAYTPIWVAHDAGYFAKEGLQDDIILIPSGTQLAQVTVAGEIDIGSMNGSSAIAAALQGFDLKIIGNSGNKMVFSLYVRPEFKTVESIKGKKIGITRFGSAPDISIRYALKKYNINPEKDLTLIQLGFMATVAAGLQGGSIEGGVVSPPTQFAVEKAGFKELISITDMDFAFPNPALVAVGSIIKTRPDVINRFMRAYTRGVHRARTDREFTYKSLAKYTKIQDTVVLQKAYDFYMSKVLEKAPYVNMVGVQNVLDDLAKTVPAAKNAKPEQFVDHRFLDSLDKSGLLKELYP
ncbi:MAG: ABC transporter substrate-binding protein [Deltaproteobacteria bacterium]|jgi:NitT/TauT family transport system substrate-binding protein|nr:ABC transporter substrate-binding protein [Deltaproteobacteria bacterium]